MLSFSFGIIFKLNPDTKGMYVWNHSSHPDTKELGSKEGLRKGSNQKVSPTA